PVGPYAMEPAGEAAPATGTAEQDARPGDVAVDGNVVRRARRLGASDRAASCIRLRSFEHVRGGPAVRALRPRLHPLEPNPGNARALVQRHGASDVWLTPPPIPLTSAEMDAVYELPYQRRPHPAYGDARIPAYEMIRFSVTFSAAVSAAARSARSPSTKA